MDQVKTNVVEQFEVFKDPIYKSIEEHITQINVYFQQLMAFQTLKKTKTLTDQYRVKKICHVYGITCLIQITDPVHLNLELVFLVQDIKQKH